MIVITQDQFNLLKSKDLVELKCDKCDITYNKYKSSCVCNMIRKGIRYFDKKTYCSKECQNASYIKNKSLNLCQQCGKQTVNPKFCSKSCAAIINGSVVPKRKRKTRYCKRCNNPREQIHKLFCNNCIAGGFNLSNKGLLEKQTLQQSIGKYEKNNNRYNAVRAHARKKYKTSDSKCVICGYNKHVEVCHIKPINTFSLDTLVSIINSPENIIILCPNHHWELDHNMLNLVDPPGKRPGNLSVMSRLL